MLILDPFCGSGSLLTSYIQEIQMDDRKTRSDSNSVTVTAS
jgi:type I restriction-modification system DNA methylase subunit